MFLFTELVSKMGDGWRWVSTQSIRNIILSLYIYFISYHITAIYIYNTLKHVNVSVNMIVFKRLFREHFVFYTQQTRQTILLQRLRNACVTSQTTQPYYVIKKGQLTQPIDIVKHEETSVVFVTDVVFKFDLLYAFRKFHLVNRVGHVQLYKGIYRYRM